MRRGNLVQSHTDWGVLDVTMRCFVTVAVAFSNYRLAVLTAKLGGSPAQPASWFQAYESLTYEVSNARCLDSTLPT